MSVGTSNRTIGKHSALNAILGKTAGVMTRNFADKKLCLVDCTAGDGLQSDHSPMTSPFILDKHANYVVSKGGKVDVHFYERSIAAAKNLKNKYGEKWHVHGDENANYMSPTWRKDDVLFVSNDPNTVNDWALPKAMNQAPKLTTVFSTLGCNAGGLKRLEKEERSIWYQHVKRQIELLQNWHDAYLVFLEGDAAQWAYLVNAPKKWKESTEIAFKRGFENSKYPIKGAWFHQENERFNAIVDWLFMTRDEYEQKHNSRDILGIFD